jgi:hypothetical protein
MLLAQALQEAGVISERQAQKAHSRHKKDKNLSECWRALAEYRATGSQEAMKRYYRLKACLPQKLRHQA